MKTRRVPERAETDRAERFGSHKAKRKTSTNAARAGVMAIILLLPCFASQSAISTSQLFSTPESAIMFFVECVKAEDYDCALSACAIDEIADGFDYEAMAKWLRILSPTSRYLPSEYGLFAAFNRHSLEYLILWQLSWMALSVVLPPEYGALLEMRILLDSTVDFDDVVSDMDPATMLRLEIVEIGRSHLLDTERNEEYLAQQADIYAAQAATSRAVLYEIDGEYYVGGVQLLQYGGNWLITSLQDPLINQPSTGVLIRVNGPSEFDVLLNE